MSASLAVVVPGKPYDAHTWSGCSPFFLRALERAGCATTAVGAVVPRAEHFLIAATVPHPNRNVWSFRANANVWQRRAASHQALRELAKIDTASYDTVLQILTLFDVMGLPGKRSASYNDTNIFSMAKHFPECANPNSSLVRAAIRYEADIYARTGVIFTMSRWAADTFVRDLGIPASKVEPVGAGINMLAPEPFTEKRYDRKNILMIGRDFSRKGGFVLLEAFERVHKIMPEATLTLLGSAYTGPLPEGATNIGFISKRTEEGMQLVRDAYRQASVFAMPSLWEPFGIAVLEAQAYGLPCVGTDGYAMRETIADPGAGVVVPPRDPRALADALVELLRDPEACAQMGDNGRKNQANYYTWDGVAGRIASRLAQAS